jgi:hypothetical protein
VGKDTQKSEVERRHFKENSTGYNSPLKMEERIMK